MPEDPLQALRVLHDEQLRIEAEYKSKVSQAKARIQQAALQIAAADAEMDHAWQMYWTMGYVNVGTLAEGYGFKNISAFRQAVGPGYQQNACGVCGQLISSQLNSRSYTPGLRDLLCDECRAVEDASREAENLSEARRIHELQVMPYAEYLKTDHWAELRAQKLRSAKYRCQVCNTNQHILDVHHRTYERRGRELLNDLTVLCRPCHERHHVGDKYEAT